LDGLAELSRSEECAGQGAVPGMARHLLGCHVEQSCLSSWLTDWPEGPGAGKGALMFTAWEKRPRSLADSLDPAHPA